MNSGAFSKIKKISLITSVFLLLVSGISNAQLEFFGPTKLLNISDFNIEGEIKYVKVSAPNPNLVSFEAYEKREYNNLFWFDNGSEKKTRHLISVAGVESDDQNTVTRELDWCPVVIQNKYWFVFSCVNEKNEDIYLGNTNEDFYIRLTKGKESDRSAKWSPNGNSIVYVSTVENKANSDLIAITNVKEIINEYEKWLVNKPGNESVKIFEKAYNIIKEVKVAATSASETDPEWSPDGKYIAYSVENASGKSVSYDIAVTEYMKQNDKKLRVKFPLLLTNTPNQSEMKPKWSSDNRSIAIFVVPAGSNISEEKQVSLWYIDLKSDFSSYGLNRVSNDVKRDIFSYPQWGDDPRSLYYIKGKGTSTSLAYVNLDKKKKEKGKETYIVNTILGDSSGIALVDLFVSDRGKFSRIYFISYEKQNYYISLLTSITDDRKTIIGTTEAAAPEYHTPHWSIGVSAGIDKSGDATMDNLEYGSTFSITYTFDQKLIPFGLAAKLALGNYYLLNKVSGRIPFQKVFEFAGRVSYDVTGKNNGTVVFADLGLCVGLLTSYAENNEMKSNARVIAPALGIGYAQRLSDFISASFMLNYKMLSESINVGDESKASVLNVQVGLNYIF